MQLKAFSICLEIFFELQNVFHTCLQCLQDISIQVVRA